MSHGHSGDAGSGAAVDAGSFVPGEGDPSPGPTALIVVVGFLHVYLIVLALQTLFYREREEEYVRKTYGQPPEELVRARSEQLENLKEYRWLDRSQGVVGIPIERAMQLVVQEEAARRRMRPHPPEGSSGSSATGSAPSTGHGQVPTGH